MTYNQTIEFLFSQLPAFHRIGKAAYRDNLDNSMALDDYFGHSHNNFRSIHIAGTNGKGSVSHMTASVLMEAGYITGLYTSPHLKDFRERIRVNGKMISKNEVIAFVKNHREIIESLKPSFFEMTVAMAFDYFARREVDYAVVEVGLGGRLDSTNIISPVLSVITNIGHDHMDLLGSTFKEVAYEKAGIIKKNSPAVVGETQDETKAVFLEKAREMGSEICFADRKFDCSLDESQSAEGERHFVIRESPSGSGLRGLIPLGGDYQAKNLQTLFQIFKSLSDSEKITSGIILEGIRKVVINTGLKGRWQVLGRRPLTICDTGHNREGLEYVFRQLMKIPANRLHIVIGFVADKDIDQVLPLFPKNATYYFTKASIPRALDENILMAKAAGYGLEGKSYPSVDEAFKSAKKGALRSDLIFIGGSTFVVAEVI